MAGIIEVKKKGEWYTVEGVDSTGHRTSADIHASDVEGKGDAHARYTLDRSVERIGAFERAQRSERG